MIYIPQQITQYFSTFFDWRYDFKADDSNLLMHRKIKYFFSCNMHHDQYFFNINYINLDDQLVGSIPQLARYKIIDRVSLLLLIDQVHV